MLFAGGGGIERVLFAGGGGIEGVLFPGGGGIEGVLFPGDGGIEGVLFYLRSYPEGRPGDFDISPLSGISRMPV